MKFSVKRFKDEPLLVSVSSEDPAGNWCGEAVREVYQDIAAPGSAIPFNLEMRLQRTGAQIDLSGTLRFTVEVSCARCLDPFQSTQTLPLRTTFVAKTLVSDASDENDAESPETDLSVWTYDHDEVDLRDVLREWVALSLPYRFLCSDTCKGLCPHCGANANRELCTCTDQKVDPRFAVLAGWKKH